MATTDSIERAPEEAKRRSHRTKEARDMRKGILGALTAAAVSLPAAAAEIGVPKPGQTGFQPATTELARDLQTMDNILLVIITVIVLFVMALLAVVIVRYNRKANATPARFTHNALIEVVWTAVPVMILVGLAFPSLNLLYKQIEVPEAELTIKATGHQWYWSHEYPDYGVDFDSIMVGANFATWDDLMADDFGRAEVEEYGVTRETWKLATDTRVIVPVDTVVKVQVTASDVIHAWTIPSFGVKMDAIPGRLNELWFEAEQIGVFYGQCSELCGVAHAYMPITVEVVSREDFDAWMEETRTASGLGPVEPELLLAGERPQIVAQAD
jgi:cytochrome c oxidase subunit 2